MYEPKLSLYERDYLLCEPRTEKGETTSYIAPSTQNRVPIPIPDWTCFLILQTPLPE